MKYSMDAILVVEGTGDSSFLSSFIDCEIVTTNGLDIPKRELEYLSEASKKRQIIILTDSDEAGETIRKRLHDRIEATDVRVDPHCCNKNGKHGIAECTKEEVVKKLSIFFTKVKKDKENLTLKNIYCLESSSNEFYLFIRKKFCLGECNLKQMIKRLNTLGITQKELEEADKEYSKYGNQ